MKRYKLFLRYLCAFIMFSSFFNSNTSYAGSFYDLSFKSIDGNNVNLSEFEDKVVFIVNTASFCGFTNQFKGIQEISERYEGRGLVVIGFPSNDFGQEANSPNEVKKICTLNYDVNFLMADISSVTGNKAHPLFNFLKLNLGERSVPKWNFYKYIIGRDGVPINWFSSITKPTNKKIITSIELALAQQL